MQRDSWLVLLVAFASGILAVSLAFVHCWDCMMCSHSPGTLVAQPLIPRRRVFIFGIDGIGNLPAEFHVPNIDNIVGSGAYSFNVTTAFPSLSMECWSTILHSVPPSVHGYYTTKRSALVPFPLDSDYPSILRLAAKRGYVTASISNWPPINSIIIEDHLANFRGSVVVDTESLVDEFARVINDGLPAVTFMQIDETDLVGHRNGYFTEEHQQALSRVDSQLGKMFRLIRALPGENYIIVISDHGGNGRGWGMHGSDLPIDMTVFWGLSGPGIPHVETKGMTTLDVAPVVARILGLNPAPKWQGRVPEALLSTVS